MPPQIITIIFKLTTEAFIASIFPVKNTITPLLQLTPSKLKINTQIHEQIGNIPAL